MDDQHPQPVAGRQIGTAPDPGGPPHVSLATIFWIFFQIGSLSIGGGLTAWLYREIVEKRRLLSETDFMGAMTLAQVLPGINMTNMSVYVGQRLRGVRGAIAAMLGLTLVPFFAIITLGTLYTQIKDIPALHHVLDGMAAAAVGLLLAMSVKSIKVTRMRPIQLVITAIVIVTVGVLRWPMVPVIVLLAPVSVALVWPRNDPDTDNASGGRHA